MQSPDDVPLSPGWYFLLICVVSLVIFWKINDSANVVPEWWMYFALAFIEFILYKFIRWMF